jgi:hypothetical protein
MAPHTAVVIGLHGLSGSASGPASVGYAILALLVLAVLSAGIYYVVLSTRGDDDSEGGSDPDGRGRGGGPGHPPEPSGPQPAWWPEFERQFAAYVESIARQQVSTAPGRRRPVPARAAA